MVAIWGYAIAFFLPSKPPLFLHFNFLLTLILLIASVVWELLGIRVERSLTKNTEKHWSGASVINVCWWHKMGMKLQVKCVCCLFGASTPNKWTWNFVFILHLKTPFLFTCALHARCLSSQYVFFVDLIFSMKWQLKGFPTILSYFGCLIYYCASPCGSGHFAIRKTK